MAHPVTYLPLVCLLLAVTAGTSHDATKRYFRAALLPEADIATPGNSLWDSLKTSAAGEGNKQPPKKKGEADEEDEDRKTLSQQISDGKYGLIEKEIYARPPLRPGIISYKTNPEVPKDTIKNLGGLDAEEIWLAEDHVLVLRGGWFPNNYNRSDGPTWPPIDDYNAPARQVKIPSRPKVPPPFPVQLKDGGPTHFIGPNGTKSQHPFPPPYFPFPPGDGFYPPPGNGSSFPPPPYPYLPPQNGSLHPPPQEGPQSLPYPPPPHGYMPFPNGSLPFGPLPPFFPPLPPGAAFLPPPGNQTEFDEDDPSIYYPPPYDFYYPQDNSTQVPPGPLVPGIILPPPPDFFAPLHDEKPRRPTSTPLPHVPFHKTTSNPNTIPRRTPHPHVPFGVYPPTASPGRKPTRLPATQTPYGVYPPTASVSIRPDTTPLPPYEKYPPVTATPPPIYYPRPTKLPTTPATLYYSRPTKLTTVPVDGSPTPPRYYTRPTKLSTPPPIYYPLPRDPSTTASADPTSQPPSPTPYGGYLPGTRPTAKRPYLTYVPVTTALRKKKPRPTTTPKEEYQYVDTEKPQIDSDPQQGYARPQPPQFVVPQNVQLFHKGESPITVRPYYIDNNSEVGPSTEDNAITSTPRPNYISEDSLSKLKDILYTTPAPAVSYNSDVPNVVETVKQIPPRDYSEVAAGVDVVKAVEYQSEAPPRYQSELTKRPIFVQEFQQQNYNRELTSTPNYQEAEIDNNSVHPTSHTYRNNLATTPAPEYYQPQAPNRTPKTTYYFYDEPQYSQGSYLGDLTTAKPYNYNAPKYQYGNSRPSPQANYNAPNTNYKSQEAILLAQIAQTLRQPGSGYFYNAPNKQAQVAPNYYRGRNQQYYQDQRPNPGYSNSSPRPGFYITRKPEYYPSQTERPFNYANYNQGQVAPNKNFPYDFEDTFQSTEHPPPKQYNTTPRPPTYQRAISPQRGQQQNSLNTSPKTVYEFSYQQHPQADTSSNFVNTERPRQRPPKVQSTTLRYYDDYSQRATPDTNNQIYQTTTPTPQRKYPVNQLVTPDPLSNFFTQQDDTVLDDITKKYFTIFGQKLPAKGGEQPAYGNVPVTTPLPGVVKSRYPTRGYENQPAGGQGYEVKPTEIPLYDDIAVNYRAPRPPINPDSEFINPELYEGGDAGGKLISYKLPGDDGAEGGHFYFLTPQVAKQQQQQQRQQQGGNREEAYSYPVPDRGLRTRRNKTKQR